MPSNLTTELNGVPEALGARRTANERNPVWQSRSRAPVKLLVGRQVAHVF